MSHLYGNFSIAALLEELGRRTKTRAVDDGWPHVIIKYDISDAGERVRCFEFEQLHSSDAAEGDLAILSHFSNGQLQ